MKTEIWDFVATCDACQRHKGEIAKTPGKFQLLPFPTHIWVDTSMDSIVGLIRPTKKYMIMVVFDRLSKYAHFCALPHLFTPSLVAQV
jgi:hypothetical protein